MKAQQEIPALAAATGWAVETLPGNSVELRRGNRVACVSFTAAGAVQGAQLISVGPSGKIGDRDAKIIDSAWDRNRRAVVQRWLTFNGEDK